MPDLALTMPQAQEAAEMYADGKSLREIGRCFGRSQQAVYRALLAIGVQPRSKSAAGIVFHRAAASRSQRVASVFDLAR